MNLTIYYFMKFIEIKFIYLIKLYFCEIKFNNF